MTDEELAKIINAAYRAGQLNAMETVRRLPPSAKYMDFMKAIYNRLFAAPPPCRICERNAVLQELCCFACITDVRNPHRQVFREKQE